MKPQILVYTAFTETSRNTLEYACSLALERNYDLLLIHNFDAPLNYSADALAMGSIDKNIEETNERLKEEADWAMERFQGISIIEQLTYGSKEEAIREVMKDYNPSFIIIGAPESMGEFWGWNDSFVDIIDMIPIPTLIIPKSVSYQRFTNIGFACDYANPVTKQQVDFIRTITENGTINLHVIHVSVPNKKNEEQRILHKAMLDEQLADCHPIFASIENSDVVATIINYIRTNSVELLVVIPHRHGIWYSIFNQRHTKRLTRINHLPILTLHE